MPKKKTETGCIKENVIKWELEGERINSFKAQYRGINLNLVITEKFPWISIQGEPSTEIGTITFGSSTPHPKDNKEEDFRKFYEEIQGVEALKSLNLPSSNYYNTATNIEPSERMHDYSIYLENCFDYPVVMCTSRTEADKRIISIIDAIIELGH
jgi:hypothetical protein